MTSFPATEEQPPFKDYCLILQIHPEADAGMVEAAYWHLAKRYNEQADHDPLAAAKLDELNEAYSVLGSPSRREEYFQVRNAILGIGTLPSPPIKAPEAPPLSVLAKQKPRERVQPLASSTQSPRQRSVDLRIRRFVEPSWQNTLLVLIFLSVATSTLAVSASLVVVLPLMALSMLISGIPVLRKLAELDAVDRLLHETPPPQDSSLPRRP